MVEESALLLILTGSSLLLFATKVVMVVNVIFMISMLHVHGRSVGDGITLHLIAFHGPILHRVSLQRLLLLQLLTRQLLWLLLKMIARPRCKDVVLLRLLLRLMLLLLPQLELLAMLHIVLAELPTILLLSSQ